MDRRLLAGIVMLGVLSAGGLASAREPTVNSVQKQDFPAQPQARGATKVPDGTVPPPPHAQPEAPLGDLAKPAAVGPAQANTTGNIDSDIPLGATPQTMPSTISEQNAALDKLPTGAWQFPLTREKRQLVAENMQALPDTGSNSGLRDLDVTAFLPTDMPMQSFPAELLRQVLEAGRYKYVKRDGVLSIVDPPNLTVVGDIHL